MPIIARTDVMPRVYAARASNPDDNWTQTVTKLIPVEVIAAYTAAVKLLGGVAPSQSLQIAAWALLVVSLVATPLYLVATWDDDPKVRKTELPTAWPQLLLAMSALAVWSFSLGGAPWSAFSWYTDWLGGLALILGGLLLTALSRLRGQSNGG